LIWILELVHCCSDAAPVAARGMRMFCAKSLVPHDEQKAEAVMTTVSPLEHFLCQIYADLTSYHNLLLVPTR
jgi:hypothetical protein